MTTRSRVSGATQAFPRRNHDRHPSVRNGRNRFGHAMRIGIVLVALLLPLIGAIANTGIAVARQSTTGTGDSVYVIPIHGEIEPGIGHFLERSLDAARDAGASTVILDINTPGGRLDTVLEMRDAILDSPLQTVAFVNREAFSAGALITIASNQIWMAPGAVFGAATPIDGGTGETADAKIVSAVRSTFRATAEERDRDPVIAEAMVDTSVTVDGLDSATTLLTLTTDQAERTGYLTGVAGDRAELLTDLGLGDASVTVTSVSPVEHLVRWVTDPTFSSLLIMLGLFLIIADGLFAGFGFVAVIGALCLGLFFWGYLLAGLAGWEGLVLVALGLGLIALEVFVIPGFGLAGISGMIALAGGLFLTMSGSGFGTFQFTDEVVRSAWLTLLAIGGAVAGVIGVATLMPRFAGGGSGRLLGGGLALNATVDDDGHPMGRLPDRPGWLVRSLHGDAVLKQDDQAVPDLSERRRR